MQELLAIQRQGDLRDAISRSREAFRAARAEILSESAATLKQKLDANISTSINDSRGKVRSWQQPHEGSGGGYIAIRSVRGGGSNGPGAVTNYLESGHDIRSPSGKASRYVPDIQVARARAFHFYRNTDDAAKKIEADAAKRIEAAIARELEG